MDRQEINRALAKAIAYKNCGKDDAGVRRDLGCRVGVKMDCKQCGEPMNPVEAMVSATHGVCGKCTRDNHRRAAK